MKARFQILVLLLLAGDLLAAPVPLYPDGHYAGTLADGRAVQLLLRWSSKAPQACVQIEGNPYCATLALKTNFAGNATFTALPFSEAGRWAISGLSLTVAELPQRAAGELILTDAQTRVGLAVTNVATVETFSRKRGAIVAGRGGAKQFAAEWPGFRTSTPWHQALSERFQAAAKGDAGAFTSGAYQVMWEGLKDGGASWAWEGSSEVRIVWLATNLISLCEWNSEFTGGAHGNLALVGRNFHCAAGKVRELKIEDLFGPGPGWSNAVSAACLRELRRQKAAWTLPSASPGLQVKGFKAADLQSFGLDRTGLIIHFPDYAVGPHAEGLYSVLIPWKELEPVLNPAGPATWFPLHR